VVGTITRIDIVRKEVTLDCGMEFKFPFSFMPRDIQVGEHVYLDQQTGKFKKIKRQTEKEKT
jgi:hypothetical protein